MDFTSLTADASQFSAHGGGNVSGGIGPTKSAFDDSMVPPKLPSDIVRGDKVG